MRTTNTFGIQFITRMNKMKNGLVPIYARITVDSKRVEISLKRLVRPAEWNSVKGMARGSRDDVKSLNHYLEEVRSNLISCYQKMQIQNQLITAEAVKSKFLGVSIKDHTLRKLIEYHNTQMKDTLAWGTLKNYLTTQKYLEKFLRENRNTSDIFLSELSFKFINDFELFLRNRKPIDHQKPLGNNGIMKHIERFRKMINLAIRLEWLEKDPFAKFKTRFIRNDREFLTEEELDTIEHKNFTVERLIWVRDLFIFSCYTGLAYCDVMNLTNQNIAKGIDGEFWIMTERKKTGQSVRVPLLPKAAEIIEGYQGHIKAIRTGTIFPMISNQKLNAYLKEIADCCGIEKNLTFHLARHTFATTITLVNGVPIETVSKMLGHTSIRTTQIYAKVVEKKVSQDMNTLKTILEKRKIKA